MKDEQKTKCGMSLRIIRSTFSFGHWPLKSQSPIRISCSVTLSKNRLGRIFCELNGHVFNMSSCEFHRHRRSNRNAPACYHLVGATCDVRPSRFYAPEQDFRRMNKRWNVSLPNEDFGTMNKRWNADFRSTFQGREYSIWATSHWKVSRKSAFHLLFIVTKSSFGEHKMRIFMGRCWHKWVGMRCIPTSAVGA